MCVCSIIKTYCSAYLMVLQDHCGECSGESEDIGKAACALCIQHSYWLTFLCSKVSES